MNKIVGIDGRSLGGEEQQQQPAPQQQQQMIFEMGKGECLVIATGDGHMFYPDHGIAFVPFVQAPIIYWQNSASGQVFKAAQYTAMGIPLQMLVVPEPSWWQHREKGAKFANPFENF